MGRISVLVPTEEMVHLSHNIRVFDTLLRG